MKQKETWGTLIQTPNHIRVGKEYTLWRMFGKDSFCYNIGGLYGHYSGGYSDFVVYKKSIFTSKSFVLLYYQKVQL